MTIACCSGVSVHLFLQRPLGPSRLAPLACDSLAGDAGREGGAGPAPADLARPSSGSILQSLSL